MTKIDAFGEIIKTPLVNASKTAGKTASDIERKAAEILAEAKPLPGGTNPFIARLNAQSSSAQAEIISNKLDAEKIKRKDYKKPFTFTF